MSTVYLCICLPLRVGKGCLPFLSAVARKAGSHLSQELPAKTVLSWELSMDWERVPAPRGEGDSVHLTSLLPTRSSWIWGASYNADA